jgi:hypothetical protein
MAFPSNLIESSLIEIESRGKPARQSKGQSLADSRRDKSSN